MIAAVVPVKNEGNRLKKTVQTLLSTPSDLIIPVINGSSDNSCRIISQVRSERIHPLYFKEPLGIDVPRAVGVKAALDRGATAVLFLDGDMNGDIAENLIDLITTVYDNRVDMALTNCYPGNYMPRLSNLASEVLNARVRLNREIGLEETLGAASPSHGPHAVSRRFLLSVSLREIAIPPVSLALAAKMGLSVGIVTDIPHNKLGSPGKDTAHSDLIAETIIGDCIEAQHVYKDTKRQRSAGSVEYMGYHPQRRWDLLDLFLAQP